MGERLLRVAKAEGESGHRAAVPLAALVEEAPAGTRASALLVLDLGQVRPDLRGTRVPFLELPACATVVDIAPADGGRFRITGAAMGGVAQLWEDIEDELEEPLQDLIEDFIGETGLAPGDPAALIEGRGPMTWRHGPAVDWWQGSTEADAGLDDGGDWVYAGAVTSDFYFGCVHAFYDAASGAIRNVYECT